jgi:hypothetical protein
MVVPAFRSFCQDFYLHRSLGSLGSERSPKQSHKLGKHAFATGIKEYDPWLFLHWMMATDPIAEMLCSGKHTTLTILK